MKPIFQTISNKDYGDCMRASVASMLDVELQMVPHFIRYDNWHSAYVYFLASFGIGWEGTGYFKNGRVPAVDEAVNGIIHASVPSLNFEGKMHSILINIDGDVVHDPSLSKSYAGRNVIDDGSLKYWCLLTTTNKPRLPAEIIKIGGVWNPEDDDK